MKNYFCLCVYDSKKCVKMDKWKKQLYIRTISISNIENIHRILIYIY